MKKHIVLTVLALLLPLCANALQVSRPLPGDSRLHVITYNPNTIHKYVGYYDFGASILLESGEEVKTISMGDPNAWQIAPSGNRIFIKPIADNPEDTITNMLMITNKRTYHFVLEAAEVGEEGINDPDLVFQTTFVYPDAESSDITQISRKSGPDLSDPSKYNFNYTMSGSSIIAPIRVFDDGEFTYFQFSKKNAEIPAFFLVDSQHREALVNYRIMGDYVVVERVTSQFTLRHGGEITCIFNEARPLRVNDITSRAESS